MKKFPDVCHYGDLEYTTLQSIIKDLMPYRKDNIRFYHFQFSRYLFGKNQEYCHALRDAHYGFVLKILGLRQDTHRALTLAIDYEGFVGVALCMSIDQYVRKEGNGIALDKLKEFYRKKK